MCCLILPKSALQNRGHAAVDLGIVRAENEASIIQPPCFFILPKVMVHQTHQVAEGKAVARIEIEGTLIRSPCSLHISCTTLRDQSQTEDIISSRSIPHRLPRSRSHDPIQHPPKRPTRILSSLSSPLHHSQSLDRKQSLVVAQRRGWCGASTTTHDLGAFHSVPKQVLESAPAQPSKPRPAGSSFTPGTPAPTP